MLQTIKSCIEILPDKSFSEFYQDYIIQSQNKISDHQINVDKHRFTSIDNISSIMSGLNERTQVKYSAQGLVHNKP